MEKKKIQCNSFLLPHKLRVITAFIVIAGLVTFFVAKPFNMNVSLPGWYLIGLGLLGFALSKEKIEDEMINSIRLRAFLFSIVSAILFVTVFDFITYLDGSTVYTSAAQILCLQLFIYIVWFRYELARHK